MRVFNNFKNFNYYFAILWRVNKYFLCNNFFRFNFNYKICLIRYVLSSFIAIFIFFVFVVAIIVIIIITVLVFISFDNFDYYSFTTLERLLIRYLLKRACFHHYYIQISYIFDLILIIILIFFDNKIKFYNIVFIRLILRIIIVRLILRVTIIYLIL